MLKQFEEDLKTAVLKKDGEVLFALGGIKNNLAFIYTKSGYDIEITDDIFEVVIYTRILYFKNIIEELEVSLNRTENYFKKRIEMLNGDEDKIKQLLEIKEKYLKEHGDEVRIYSRLDSRYYSREIINTTIENVKKEITFLEKYLTNEKNTQEIISIKEDLYKRLNDRIKQINLFDAKLKKEFDIVNDAQNLELIILNYGEIYSLNTNITDTSYLDSESYQYTGKVKVKSIYERGLELKQSIS